MLTSCVSHKCRVQAKRPAQHCTHGGKAVLRLDDACAHQERRGREKTNGARCVSKVHPFRFSKNAAKNGAAEPPIFKQRRAAASRQLHAPFNASPPVQWERLVCRRAAKEECSMSRPHSPVPSSKTLLRFHMGDDDSDPVASEPRYRGRALCSATAGLTSCRVQEEAPITWRTPSARTLFTLWDSH